MKEVGTDLPAEGHGKTSVPLFILLGGLYLYAATCTFSISASQTALGIAFIGLAAAIYQKILLPRKSPLEPAFLCFTFAGLFSIANAVSVERAVLEMKKFLIILVFWIGYWSRPSGRSQRNVIGTMLLSGSLLSMIGLVKMIYFDEFFRVYGFFSLPITFGEVQCLLAILALVWLCAPENNSLVRIGLLFAFFFLAIGVLTSFTRGAWLGLAAGITLLMIQHPRKIAPLFAVILIGGIIAAGISGGIKERLGSFDFQSNFFRFRIWQIGFEMLSERPIFGVGMNNVKQRYAHYIRSFDIKQGEVHGHLHNSFMQILVMTGIPGLVAFCWLLVQIFSLSGTAASEIPNQWQSTMAQGISAIFVCFIVSGFTEYNFGDEEVAMLAFFLCGFLAAPYEPQQSPSLQGVAQ